MGRVVTTGRGRGNGELQCLKHFPLPVGSVYLLQLHHHLLEHREGPLPIKKKIWAFTTRRFELRSTFRPIDIDRNRLLSSTAFQSGFTLVFIGEKSFEDDEEKRSEFPPIGSHGIQRLF